MRKLLPPRSGAHRRDVLRGGGALVLAAAFGPVGCATAPRVPFADNPFTLGVASGDPWPDGVVLWTRLAPGPERPDGGMGETSVDVRWQVAHDARFSRIVREGIETATPAEGWSVHAEVRGLEPGRGYHYRFIAGGAASAVGRTRTAPAPGALPDALRIAHIGCQHYEQGFYTVYGHIAREDLDLIVHTGDYIYEGAAPSGSSSAVRLHQAFACHTLEEYRLRYALYRADADSRAAHAAHPLAAVWDDHEFVNDWAGGAPGASAAFLARRAAAFRAWWEHMPVRRAQGPVDGAARIYRALTFGRLARINLCDTRQYRTKQPCGGGHVAPCGGELDPNADMLGPAQERWLTRGLAESKTAWNATVNGVPLTQIDRDPDPDGVRYGMDKWDGYRVPRRRLLEHVAEARVRGPVFLAGDIHRHLAAELRPDFDRPETPAVATEFVNTALSSNGDGNGMGRAMRTWLSQNPHIRFAYNRRGYVRHTVRPGHWQADFQVVDYVSKPGAPQRTAARTVVEAERPLILQA